MLDPHREVVALHPVEPAVVAPVQRAVVQRRDVPRAVPLEHELGDGAAVLVHHVMGAGLRDGILEPAPATRVVALAGVDDHQVDRPGRIGGPLVEVGRRSPHRRCVVRRSGCRRRGAGARCRRGRKAWPSSGARERTVHVTRVRRTAFVEPDVAVAGHDGGPRLDVRPVDAGLARVQVEQRGRGADVGDGIVARRLDGYPCECGSPLERRASQRHDPERRSPPGEFFRPFYHLPAGLHPAEPGEQCRRHVELGPSRPERGVEWRRSGGGRRDVGDHLAGGARLHRRMTAGGEQDEQRRRRLAHGPCFTSSSRRAGPASSVTRYGSFVGRPRTHSTWPSKSHTSFTSWTAGKPGTRSRCRGTGLPWSSCARAGSRWTTRRSLPATDTTSPGPQLRTGPAAYSTRKPGALSVESSNTTRSYPRADAAVTERSMAAGTPARVGLSRCTGAVVPAKVVSCDTDAGAALGAPRADWRGSLPRHAAQTSAAKATGTKRRGMSCAITPPVGRGRLTHQYS